MVHRTFRISTQVTNSPTSCTVLKRMCQSTGKCQLPTAAPVGANRPDIIIKGKDEAFLVDVSVPLDRNIRRKSVEKIQKYQGLKREVEQMWQVRAKIVPVIVGALGGLTPSTADFVRELDAGASVSILQKEALLGTVDIIRSITQMK
eukprot:scpid49074/ scgid21864/ 